MYAKPQDPAASAAALGFFEWGYKNGKQLAADLDYVPMPNNVVSLVEKTWRNEIKGPDGKTIYASDK